MEGKENKMLFTDLEFADYLIVSAGVVGLVFSYYQYTLIARTTIKPQPTSESSSLRMLDPKITENLYEVYSAISEGAETFLHSEYKICGAFVVCFAGLLFALISMASSVEDGVLTTAAFVTGALTSMVAVYIGMKVAVFSNARTTKAAAQNYGDMQYTAAFNVAFRAGSCMGFCLCAVGLLVLWLLLQFSKAYFSLGDYDVMMRAFRGTAWAAAAWPCLAAWAAASSPRPPTWAQTWWASATWASPKTTRATPR